MPCENAETSYGTYDRWLDRRLSCQVAGAEHRILLNGREIARGQELRIIGVVDP